MHPRILPSVKQNIPKNLLDLHHPCNPASALMSELKLKLYLIWGSCCFKLEVILYPWAAGRRINLLVAAGFKENAVPLIE